MRNKTAIALLIGLVAISLCGCASSDYKKAEELLAAGSYEEALVLYESLETNGGYEDSAEKVMECNYNIAGKAYEEMDYSKSAEMYAALTEYKDSAELEKKSEYALANVYALNENFIDAYEVFFKLGSYEKSSELASVCQERMLNSADVGDELFYGKYEQDGDTENGEEPIRWLVIAKSDDNDKVLIISKYLLDMVKFSKSDKSEWEISDQREWYNTEFLESVFSETEKNSIQRMITSELTDDLVFNLSAEEARAFFADDESRVATPTEALLAKDFEVWSSQKDSADWWTRSVASAKNGKGVVYVNGSGEVKSTGIAANSPNQYSTGADIGIRPAVCISLSETTEEAQNMLCFGIDSNIGLDNEPDLYQGGKYLKNYQKGGSSGGKCPNCNGTGYVKYYYGSSDLEAWLSGHDSYTTGPCSMCGGTGKG